MMADAGYTVISTPFAVTFKHTDCAAAVHEVSCRQCSFSWFSARRVSRCEADRCWRIGRRRKCPLGLAAFGSKVSIHHYALR